MANHAENRRPDESEPLLSRIVTSRSEEPGPTTAESAQTQISVIRAGLIIAAIFFLLFIFTCNVSLITTIQSPIATELNASSEVTWFNSAFLIAITSITPISGKLIQIFTPRNYLFVSILIQAVGLLVASQAPTLHVFLAGRVLCGIGSASITPVAFILVNELASKKRRGLLFGLMNTGYTTGVACGAIIAGALEPVVGWRAIFWLQIPFSVVAAFAAFLAIPKHQKVSSENEDLSMIRKLAKIDYFGVLTLIFALVLLLFTLSAPKLETAPLVLAIAALLLFLFVEMKWAVEPIVPPSILQSRANLLTGIATVGLMSARWGVLFYTPVYAISVRGWSQSAAGSLLVPTNAGFATGGIVAGWLHIRRTGSFYVPTLVCFALFALIHFSLSQLLTSESSLELFIAGLFLNGFVVGALLNYSLAHLLHLTNSTTHVLVIPINATFRSFSGSFGSAISGGYFLRRLSDYLRQGFKSTGIKHREDLIRKLIGSPQLVQKLSGAEKEIAIYAYSAALKQMFIAGAGIAIVMMVLQAGTGWTGGDQDTKLERQITDEGIEGNVSREPSVG